MGMKVINNMLYTFFLLALNSITTKVIIKLYSNQALVEIKNMLYTFLHTMKINCGVPLSIVVTNQLTQFNMLLQANANLTFDSLQDPLSNRVLINLYWNLLERILSLQCRRDLGFNSPCTWLWPILLKNKIKYEFELRTFHLYLCTTASSKLHIQNTLAILLVIVSLEQDFVCLYKFI